ncbi:MAG TPA: glycosyltransferase family 9 protein [Terracidiphilus sp.]|jgi:heptosyltransferase-2
MRSATASRKKAIIVKLGQIGDVIMTIPAVKTLHEQGYDIDWVVGRAARPLLECYSWIRVIPVDDKAIFAGSFFERVKAILCFWSIVISTRYEMCATLYYDSRFRILTLPIRARRKFSLSRRSNRTRELLPGRSHTDEFVRLLGGKQDTCGEQSVSPLRPDKLPSSRLPLKSASRRVAMVPGGAANLVRKQGLRRWPIENYVTLATELVARCWEVVLLGGPEDSELSEHFERLTVTNCIGRLSLPEVISVCDSCDAVVSHDTGPLHLAGLSKSCLVGIFGPTDPAMFLPRRSFVAGIWGGQGLACRPCYDGTNFAPCGFNACMHQVTVEMVLVELDRLLSARSVGASSPWRFVMPTDNEISCTL